MGFESTLKTSPLRYHFTAIRITGLLLGILLTLLGIGGLIQLLIEGENIREPAIASGEIVASALLFIVEGVSGILTFFLRKKRSGIYFIWIFAVTLILNISWLPFALMIPEKWPALIPLIFTTIGVWIVTVLLSNSRQQLS